MQLCYFPGTISIVSAITLHEAGLAFDPVLVDFKAAEQTKTAYHAINPKGRVPALITDRGVLTETGAIQDFIAATAPGAGLVPDDPFAAARMREAMYFLAATMHVNHAHKMRGYRWADNEASWTDMTAKVPETMAAAAAYVEDSVLQGPYVLGETFSLADPYLYVVANWLEGDGVPVADYPKLDVFMTAMSARPSVARVRADGML